MLDITLDARASELTGSNFGVRRKSNAVRTSRPPRLAVPSRRPPHPGHFLETRYLVPLAINQTDFAKAIGVSRRRVNEMIRGRRGITPDTAIRLATFFGNDPMFWIQLQVAWDMRAAVRSLHASPRC